MTHGWFDEEAGPVVRPYAMTRGRTRGTAAEPLDLIALVTAEIDGTEELPADAGLPGGQSLAPEHAEILHRCRRASESVAELAAGLDLPLGVIRVLVSDLLDAGLVRVSRPIPAAQLPDENILREVIDGLRAL